MDYQEKKYSLEKVKEVILTSFFQKKSVRDIAEKTGIEVFIVREWLNLKHVCLYFLIMSEELFSFHTLVERISCLSAHVKN